MKTVGLKAWEIFLKTQAHKLLLQLVDQRPYKLVAGIFDTDLLTVLGIASDIEVNTLFPGKGHLLQRFTLAICITARVKPYNKFNRPAAQFSP